MLFESRRGDLAVLSFSSLHMRRFPHLGHGIGLRPPHYQPLLRALRAATTPGDRPVDWVEIISENFMVEGGNPRAILRQVRAELPVVMHGVSLSLGSVDPLDAGYLQALVALAREVEPAWISDHLCWSSFGGHTGHDLWPLPFTEEALEHVATRVLAVQERLRRPLLIENVSSYLRFVHSAMTEWEFLSALVARTGCGLLLDVNNIFVSAHNHGFDPRTYLRALPPERIGQIHLAGHSVEGELLIDTHDAHVRPEVWELYADAIAGLGPRATMIEWDANVPAFSVLEEERARAATWAARGLERRGQPDSPLPPGRSRGRDAA